MRSQVKRITILVSAVVAMGVGFTAPAPAVARMAATMAYSFPQQCTVLPVTNKPFAKARAFLATLGCRTRRIEHASTIAKGLVISAVGGERTYAFGHTVTLIVSSGPAEAT